MFKLLHPLLELHFLLHDLQEAALQLLHGYMEGLVTLLRRRVIHIPGDHCLLFKLALDWGCQVSQAPAPCLLLSQLHT